MRTIRTIVFAFKQPHNLFLLLALVFGTLFVYTTPPLQVADEQAHFYRAYQLAGLNLKAEVITDDRGKVGVGDYLPAGLVVGANRLMGEVASNPHHKFDPRLINASRGVQVNAPGQRKPVHFEGAALYSPVPYIPQASVIFVAKLAHLSLPTTLALGRMVNLIAWMALVYCAIRLLPVGKWAMLVLGLLPMVLFQAASLSADAVTNGLIFLLIALFVRLLQQKHQYAHRLLVFVLLIGLLLALSKPAYVPLLALFLLLPAGQFGSSKQRWLFFGGLTVAALAQVAWSMYVRDVVDYLTAQLRPGIHVDSHAQLSLIIADPKAFLDVLWATYSGDIGSGLWTQFVGMFDWSRALMPTWSVWLSFGLIALALVHALFDQPNLQMSRWRTGGVILVSVALFGLISLPLYLTYTVVGGGTIRGLQGRYFLPLVLLLIPLLAARTTRKRPDWLRRFAPPVLVAGSVTLLITALVVIVQRYYVA